MFPDALTRKLLRMPANEWRSIRTRVMRNVDHGKDPLAPPQELRSYIERMPENYQLWEEYALDITRQRRNGSVKRKRDAARKRDKISQEHHRDYMRDYMRDYRSGHKRRSTSM